MRFPPAPDLRALRHGLLETRESRDLAGGCPCLRGDTADLPGPRVFKDGMPVPAGRYVKFWS